MNNIKTALEYLLLTERKHYESNPSDNHIYLIAQKAIETLKTTQRAKCKKCLTSEKWQSFTDSWNIPYTCFRCLFRDEDLFYENSNIEKSVCGWTLEDVYEQAESLEIEISEEEAQEILNKFSSKFDANDGYTLICNLLEDLKEKNNEYRIHYKHPRYGEGSEVLRTLVENDVLERAFILEKEGHKILDIYEVLSESDAVGLNTDYKKYKKES